MKFGLVIAAPGAAPDAMLGPESRGAATGYCWSGQWRELAVFSRVGRLMGEDAVFSPRLSARWRRLVVCTPEFAAWWLARVDEPATNVFLEVLG